MKIPHVLVDARFSEQRRGGDRCKLELARGLMCRGRCRYTFLVFPVGKKLLESIDSSVKTVVTTFPPDRHPHAEIFEHILLPKICRQLKVDLYHGTFQVVPMRRAAPVTVVTIHDLALFTFPEAYSWKFVPYMRALLGRGIATADHVVTVSDATRAEIQRRFPTAAAKMTTIYNGVGNEFLEHSSPESIEQTRRQLGLPEQYILFVGNLERKKNLPRLIRAFLSLRSEGEITESLVIVGSTPHKLPFDSVQDLFGDGNEDWLDHARARGVHFTGYVSDADLPGIYRGACAVAYPSLYEGFGMPILEGMASRVPVLTSNLSSLPEVAGGAACLVDPMDVKSIASGLKKILQDKGWRRTAIEAGLRRAAELSWDAHAQQTESLYVSLLSHLV